MKNTMTADEYIKHQQITKENIKKVQKVKRFLDEHKPDLVINRGMGTSIQDFIAWTKEEFRDDRGASFKFLWELCFPKALEIEQRLNELESKSTKPTKTIKAINGKIIR